MDPSSTFCTVCEVSVSGNFDSHTQGKKHVRLVQMRGHQRVAAERTIYVRGFSHTTTVHALATHFSNYGRITKINMLPKDKGKYAFIEFGSGNEAQAALKPSVCHLVGGHRLVVRPKEVRVLAGPPAIAARHAADPPVNVAPTINYKQVKEELRAADSVLTQMTRLRELLTLPPGDIEAREKIVENLEAMFKTRIPGCCVRPFGSSVNGFGVRGCDMDIFLDLNLGPAPTPSPNEPHTPTVMLRIDDTGPRLIAGLEQATVMQRISYVYKALARSNLQLAKLMKIPASRCPVVQFVDAVSGTQCDLSVNNRLALQNTELLQALCRIEPRLQTLIYTLRYFFKSREISGGASGTQKLTSYALCWLAITYMQQCDPPLLPSIDRLKELAGDREHTITDDWDTTFSRDPDAWHTNTARSSTPLDETLTPAIDGSANEQPQPTGADVEAAGGSPSPANNQPADELLTGFFNFYSGLNLATSVVCPRLGKVLTVDTFLAMNATHPEQKDFKLNIVNIQDPFVLSHNVAQNLNARLGERLADELNEAAAKCRCLQFTAPGKDHDWGITFLVSTERLTKLAPTSARLASLKSDGGFDYCVDMEFQAAGVPSFLFSENRSVAEVKVQWVHSICTLLRETLKDALLFTIDVTIDRENTAGEDEESDASQTKKRSSSDNCSDEPIEKRIRTKPSIATRNGVAAAEKICTIDTSSESDKSMYDDEAKVNSANCSEKTESAMCTETNEKEGAIDGDEMMCTATGKGDENATEVADKSIDSEINDQLEIVTHTLEKKASVEANSPKNAAAQGTNVIDSGAENKLDTETNPEEANKTLHMDQSESAAKETSKETLLLALSVQATQQTWAGRKRMKKEMRAAGEGVADTLLCEKIVGKLIQKELGGPSKLGTHPIMSFDVQVIKITTSNGKLSIRIQMKPTLAPKMFNSFYQFFKIFLMKLKNNSLFTFTV